MRSLYSIGSNHWHMDALPSRMSSKDRGKDSFAISLRPWWVGKQEHSSNQNLMPDGWKEHGWVDLRKLVNMCFQLWKELFFVARLSLYLRVTKMFNLSFDLVMSVQPWMILAKNRWRRLYQKNVCRRALVMDQAFVGMIMLEHAHSKSSSIMRVRLRAARHVRRDLDQQEGSI